MSLSFQTVTATRSAHSTTLDAAARRVVADRLGPSSTVSPLLGGRINATYLVGGEDQRRILRVYPPQRHLPQIAFEGAVLAHLQAQGCRVPTMLDGTASDPLDVDGRPAVWLSHVGGLPVHGPSVAPEQLAALWLPIDRALASFRPPFGPARETRVFRRAMAALTDAFSGRAGDLQRRHDDLGAWERDVGLPTGVVHADIHPGNVLRDQHGELWLIDFDDAHVGWRDLDRVLAALEFAWVDDGRLDEDRYRRLLDALSPDVSPARRAVEARLRELLALKFAAQLAELGDLDGARRYLALLP